MTATDPKCSSIVGDLVLLDTLNLDAAHAATQGHRKLAARFIVPYRVLENTTPATYRISLPPDVRLHDEFYVAYLHQYHEDTNPNCLNNVSFLITRDGFEGNQIRAIIGQCTRKGIKQFEVQWYGRYEPATWKPMSSLTQAGGLIAEFLSTSPLTTTVQLSRPTTPATPAPQM